MVDGCYTESPNYQDLVLHIHIIGICGTFMGGVALLARSLGHRVTGSDANVYPPMNGQLREVGIDLMEGYRASNLYDSPDVVVIGNALSRGNEEVEYVLNKGLRYTSGAQWLSQNFLFDRWVIAVAGTHGKTTTSSMLAWILEYAGLEPGFLIGGVPRNFGVSACQGGGTFFVVEADEYDTAFFDKRSKFVHYGPRTCVLNNLEYDHADIFPDLSAIKTQFHHFVRTIPATGLLVVNHQDNNLHDVLRMGCWSKLESFATDEAKSVKQDDTSTSHESRWLHSSDGELRGPDNNTYLLPDTPALSGAHNRSNAVASIAAARHAGVPVQISLEALDSFAGVNRRLELLGIVGGVYLYDDFAHHPTAISATLTALHANLEKPGRLIALVDFSSNSMVSGTHLDSMADALTLADFALLHCNAMALDLESLCRADLTITAHRAIEPVLCHLRTLVRAGDIVVCMSNGSFQAIQSKILTMLNDQSIEP